MNKERRIQIDDQKQNDLHSSESGKIHQLKIFPQFYSAVVSGIKSFEYRRNDRGFCVGDVLELREYDPEKKEYTGRSVDVHVIYLLESGNCGIPEGFVIMGIALKCYRIGSDLCKAIRANQSRMADHAQFWEDNK